MLDKLKKLLKKEALSVNLINYGDILNIPDRNYYKKNQEVLDLIDSYKSRYFIILSNKKTVLSKELELDGLQTDILMNIDIVLRTINEENIFSLAKEELMISVIKLNLYMQEIQGMELETTIRLIALKELVSNRRIPRRNRVALIEEINHLSNTLVMFFAQKSALQKEIETYKASVNIRSDVIDDEVLQRRYEKLLFLSQDIVSQKEIDKFDSLVLKIVFVERQLELYAYQNETEIDKLANMLVTIRDNVDTHKYPMDKLLEEIKKVEAKLLVFFEYGKKSFDERHIKNIYNVKFDIYMHDMFWLLYKHSDIKGLSSEKNIYEDYNGYQYYLDIIMEKVLNILQGRNDNFNTIFEGKERKALNIIRDYIKSVGNGYFDPDSIFHNKILLGLIVSFDSENGFYKLKNISVSSKENLKERDFKGIKWLDEVFFEDVLKMNDLSPSNKSNHPIYKLYKMVDWLDYLDDGFDSWSFPSCMREINFAEMDEENLKSIREKVISRYVHLPYYLEKIERGDLVFSTKVKDVIPNKKLKIIGDRGMWGDYSLQDDIIFIDTNTIRIHENAYNIENVRDIVFEDGDGDNKILHNPELLKDFLKRFVRVEYVDNPCEGVDEKWIYLDLDCIKIQESFQAFGIGDVKSRIIPVKDRNFSVNKVSNITPHSYIVSDSEVENIVNHLSCKINDDSYELPNYEGFIDDGITWHVERG